MSISSIAGKGKRGKLAFLTGSILFIVLCAVLIAFRHSIGPSAIPLALGAFTLSFGLSLGYFAALDELAQRAQYLAWFWGSCLGLLVFLAGMVITGWPGETSAQIVEALAQRYWGGPSTLAGFAAGASIALMAQLVGAVLWWMAYWIRKR